MDLFEVKQEFESQRIQLQKANRWADQAQRDQIRLYGELELRNSLFQESQAKMCQETEELKRICAKKQIEQGKQELMNCLCIRRGILRPWVNWWVKIRGITEQSKFLVWRKRILRSWIREQLWSDPRSQSTVHNAGSRTMLRCDSGLPREGQTSTRLNNSKNLATSSQELRPDITGTPISQKWLQIQILCFSK